MACTARLRAAAALEQRSHHHPTRYAVTPVWHRSRYQSMPRERSRTPKQAVGGPRNPVWPDARRISLEDVNAPVLVGRENDLAALTDLLASGGRRARLVLLEGEAGIGKTWLANAVASAAEARGVDVRWASGPATRTRRPTGFGASSCPPWSRTVTGSSFSPSSKTRSTARADFSSSTIFNWSTSRRSAPWPTSCAHGGLRRRPCLPPGGPGTKTLRGGQGRAAAGWRRPAHLDRRGGIDREAVPALCEAMGVDLTGTTISSLHTESRGNPLVLRELVAASAGGAPRTGRYASWSVGGCASCPPGRRPWRPRQRWSVTP